MSRFQLFAQMLMLVGTLSFVGCAGQNTEPAATPDSGQTSADADKAEIEQALSQLSPEDRELAEKQKVCPVSGEPLGSMGKPMKVTVEGKDIFVCCEGCVDAVKENPDKYLKKDG